MTDEQINEVMRLCDRLAADMQKAVLGASICARADLETHLRTIGEPAGYSLPVGSIGAKKFAQVGGGFTPVGLVFSRGESAMAITEHGRVYWDRDLVHPISGEPESVNAELLEALKECVDLSWIDDSHVVDFDKSVMFGPHYDFSGVDGPCRAEFIGEHECIVWPRGGKWSAYCTYDGSLWFEKFTTSHEAKERCMRLLDKVIPDHPAMKARAAIARAESAIETPAKVSPCAGHAVQLPDPLGLLSCTHPDCGRYEGPRSHECRAMADNACARPSICQGHAVQQEADEAGGA